MKTFNKKGFTLTEILIVLVVAGILLALILPNSLKAITKANTTSDDAAIKSAKAAAVLCLGDRKTQADCTDVAKLVEGKYLKETPKKADNTAVTCKVENDDIVCQ